VDDDGRREAPQSGDRTNGGRLPPAEPPAAADDEITLGGVPAAQSGASADDETTLGGVPATARPAGAEDEAELEGEAPFDNDWPVARRTGRAPVRRGSRAARRQRRRRVLVRRLVAAAILLAVVAAIVGLAVAWPFGGDAAESSSASPEPAASLSASPAPSTDESPAPEPATVVDPAERGFTLTAGGDVLGDRSVRGVMDQYGPVGPLRKVAQYFTASDFGLVNLETPLTDGGSPQTWKDVVFKGDPRLAEGLAEAGVDVVTLANNHAMDQGAAGLLDTLKWLKREGVAACGAGKDLDDAYAPRILEAEGVKVAFIGLTDVVPVSYPATAGSPGTAPGRSDPAAVKRVIARAAKRADYVVVTWHWNFEFTTAPSALELSEGKAAIDAGADLVIAHHPHVLQGIQSYNGGLIFYSLGDLVFDGCSGPMAETVLVKLAVDARRIEAKLIPAALAYDGTPSRVRGTQAEEILSRVKSYSADLGTKVRIDDELGFVTVKRRGG
jgi:poly-gamma-glutamate capsule biosynthesis protein CapA/YwtB (metallophosphatase superfamily)